MIHVIAGLDGVAAERQLRQLKSEHDPSDQNTSVLDARTATTAQIVGQVGTSGFFGTGRVVILTEFTAKVAPAKSRGTTRDASTDLAEIIAATAPDNLLILLDTSVAALPAPLKRMLPKDARVTICEPPRGPQLVAWVQQVAQEAGGSIDAATAQYLAAKLYPQTWASAPANPRYDRPPDTIRMANEVAKLVCAAAPDPITRALVDDLVAAGDNDQIFRFSDAVGRGDLVVALRELRKMLDAGEEPARLLAQLAQQAELLAAIDASERRTNDAIAHDLGLSTPGRVAALRSARRNGAVAGSKQLAALAESDRGLKLGLLRQQEDPLYAYVIRLAFERLAR